MRMTHLEHLEVAVWHYSIIGTENEMFLFIVGVPRSRLTSILSKLIQVQLLNATGSCL